MELICPTCRKIELKSQLTEIFSGSSNIGFRNTFVDEEGRYHYHDPNMSMGVYRCSNGHELKVMKYMSCSTCKFSGGESRIQATEDFLMSIL